MQPDGTGEANYRGFQADRERALSCSRRALAGLMQLKLLVTPLARGAWFDERLEVAREELALLLPGVEAEIEHWAGLELLSVELAKERVPELARLSFLQAVFEVTGDALRPLALEPAYALPSALVTEARYPGKTNERVTAQAVNVALAVAGHGPHRLLDPVAGRGTTLLTAARYGIEAYGVERDVKALADFRRNVKKITKLHRIKHKLSEGSVIKRRRDGAGRYLAFTFPQSGVRLVAGDSADPQLVGRGRYTLVVGDLPYGIQHRGPGGRRDPLDTLAACAPTWAAALAPGGAMVLIFNALQPRPERLHALFAQQGLELLPTRCTHRMSESIVRQLAVFRRPVAS